MIEIYGTPNCTFCKQAVTLCEERNIDYTYTSVTRENFHEIESRIGHGFKTVPQIFIDDRYIPTGYNGLREELFQK